MTVSRAVIFYCHDFLFDALTIKTMLLLLAQTPPFPEPSFGMLFFKMILAMVFVVGLALLFMKYVLPRVYNMQPRLAGKVRILHRVGLEPRKSLYVVNVGHKNLLLGVTEHQIANLSELSAEDLKAMNLSGENQ